MYETGRPQLLGQPVGRTASSRSSTLLAEVRGSFQSCVGNDVTDDVTSRAWQASHAAARTRAAGIDAEMSHMTPMCHPAHDRFAGEVTDTPKCANAVHRLLPRLISASPALTPKARTDRPDPDEDITVGKHSLEKLTHEEQDRERRLQEAKAYHLASGRPISAPEREMRYHTLASHRMKLLAQGAELALRLGDILAEVERLDRQLDEFERSEF